MSAKKGDVIRFYFSESTGYTKEKTNDNTEMVDIVVEENGLLVAICDFGAGCYVHRLHGEYSVLGDVNNTEAVEALLNNGWESDFISEVKNKYNL